MATPPAYYDPDGRTLDLDRVTQAADAVVDLLTTLTPGPAEAYLVAALAARLIDQISNDQMPAAWATERERLTQIIDSSRAVKTEPDGGN